MKRLPCPGLGLRPISEFVCGGEVRTVPVDVDDTQWADWVFNRSGAPGLVREWWFHRPSGQWLALERDTLTNEITELLPMSEVRHAPV